VKDLDRVADSFNLAMHLEFLS